MSGSQGTRNGVGVGGVKNNGTSVGATTGPVTRNDPPPPSSLSSNGDSPQRCGGYRSSPSSADDSDVCVTPGVSVSHGLGVQVRHDSSGSKSKSVITSKPIPNCSGVPPKPNCSSVTSKPIASKSNSKCAQPDENDDASLLMVEDDPNDSSFGDIDMSFDMDALEETMKMYD